MEAMAERGAGAARVTVDTSPEPAPGGGSPSAWIDRCEIPALGGAFAVGLRMTELGTVIAVEGRPAPILADERFEPAYRVPLRRFGPRFTVNIESDGSMWVKDSNGNQVDLENAGEAFMKSPLAYRLTADLKLGKILLGLNYTLDTNYTFEEWEKFENIFNAPFDNGYMGVSVLFSFF